MLCRYKVLIVVSSLKWFPLLTLCYISLIEFSFYPSSLWSLFVMGHILHKWNLELTLYFYPQMISSCFSLTLSESFIRHLPTLFISLCDIYCLHWSNVLSEIWGSPTTLLCGSNADVIISRFFFCLCCYFLKHIIIIRVDGKSFFNMHCS